jgi:hypothetical protein
MRTTEKTNKKERKKEENEGHFRAGPPRRKEREKKYIDIYTAAGSSSVGWPPSKVPS